MNKVFLDKEISMIQRNILKAKTFINESVDRVLEVSRERFPLKWEPNGSLNRQTTPPWLLFAREIWRNPRAMGAALPSSPQLAQAMAKLIPQPDKQTLVVELGAGTGIVTTALLQRGITAECLIPIEQSANLARYLQQNFPHMRIINGDALHLSELLGHDCQRVSTIVSGLPFRSLPRSLKHGIMAQIDKVLPHNGLLIQFTYDLSGRFSYLPGHFKRVATRFVWSNLPPARIDVFQSINRGNC
jgi:phospholipid N-methyltransferase